MFRHFVRWKNSGNCCSRILLQIRCTS